MSNRASAEHCLARVLTDIAAVETGAVTACGLLLSTPYLTAAERAFLGGRMRAEEIGHDRMMAAWGTRWGAPRQPMAYGATVHKDLLAAARLDPAARFAFVFATLHWNEKNTVRRQARIARLMARADRDLGRDFDQVVGEEGDHVAFGRALWTRLERDEPHVAQLAARYYALVRVTYPAVIQQAHARLYARAEAALR